jgi:hypothetical protein
MAREPFHESALARYDEAQEASRKLLASLDELRQKADNFLAVAASTTTMLAALASSGPLRPPSPLGTDPTVPGSPVVDQPSVEQTPEPEPARSEAVRTDPVPPEPVRTDPAPPEPVHTEPVHTEPVHTEPAHTEPVQTDPVQTEPGQTDPVQTGPAGPEEFRRPGTERHACAVESTIAPAIISPNNVRVAVGRHFTFTVTTVGTPVPWISEKGERPKHFTFVDNCDGTASLSGRPRKTGVYFMSFKAKFGQGTLKYRVIQSFTLNVVADV